MPNVSDAKDWIFPDTTILWGRVKEFVDRKSLDPEEAAFLRNAVFVALQSAKASTAAQKTRRAVDQRKAQTITNRLIRHGEHFLPVLETWAEIYPQAQDALMQTRHILVVAQNIVDRHNAVEDRRGKAPRIEIQMLVGVLAGAYEQVYGKPATAEGDRDKSTKSKFHVFLHEVIALADFPDTIPHSTLSDALMTWRKQRGIASKKSVKKPRAKKPKIVGSFG